MAEKTQGKEPSNTIIIPGVLPYQDYKKRRATWDPIRQKIGLDAEFHSGTDVLLFPSEWLNRAQLIHETIYHSGINRVAKAIGIDPAEGGDKTVMVVIDELGIIDLISKKTPNTSVITAEAIALMNRYDVQPEKVCFDRGGGGKEHADRLRTQGYKVSTVAFGEAVTTPSRKGTVSAGNRYDSVERKYTYKNRRAEMYGMLHMLLDPSLNETGFGLPLNTYPELRKQLAPIPLTYDEEGRLELLPKRKKNSKTLLEGKSNKSLTDLIGNSPDEADALVLAVYALLGKIKKPVVGAM